MRHRILVAILAVSALLLPACGNDDTDQPSPSPDEPSSAAPSGEEPTSPTEPEPAAEPPLSWPTGDVSAPFTGTVPPVPILLDVRVGAHPDEGFDRVSLEFDTLPGYEIGYEPSIEYDGSGEPVDLSGEAFIQLVFNPAQAHGDSGEPTLDDPPVEPVDVGYAALDSYVLNGDFEGYVSIGLSLSEEVGFQVDSFRQDDGDYVVYIDLARP